MNGQVYRNGNVITNWQRGLRSGLRALSRHERAAPLMRMLQRAQQFSNLEFSPYKKVLRILEGRNWLAEASEAKIVEVV